MVSWFVKQALLNLKADIGLPGAEPSTQAKIGGKLAQALGVKGIHIAERDTQRAKTPKPMNVFVNTWSVEGFVSEGLQPAELGWGTHETWMPPERAQPCRRLRRGHLSAPAGRQYARALLDADTAGAIRLSRHA
jgi:homospermidine synthase